MTTTITMAIGYVLAGLIAAAIIFVGARFLVAPRVAAAGYGVQPDLGQPSVGAYLSVKGVRDIASGLFVLILMAAGATHLLGWLILAATVIPLADAAIVLRHGGPGSIAWGVHGGTAGLMLVTSALLLL
ncbi:DUF4267 domain-containing protein [Mycolicibacterium vaccae]|uniref:Small membrane hydrophobic protein n=1 Tax=Mycolicibacterium vaccae ATCC 25954 TaxID=1194972 RepID=K0V7B1_MYCVA|nr:DUF4267 domain-containing protein [Mycolicibacterium vaccae]EJZ06904.1 hypothetical protein MVAC_20248 [Mycolicibacterium vaccae ATCC 25954]MCV7059568.1 DUF4267 domain-containing protein [Mycolicibacterium vaccae]